MYALAPLPLGYFLLSVGGSRRILIGSNNDVSYGAYIYAFPVEQLLVVLGVHRLGYTAMFITALAVTLPLAWLSWTCVEQPAMRLKNLPNLVNRAAQPQHISANEADMLAPQQS